MRPTSRSRSRYERDRHGRVIRLGVPQGDGLDPADAAVTTFTRDSQGNVTLITHPDGSTEAYNAAGDFTSIERYKDTDGGAANLVFETSFDYDGIGRLTDLTHLKGTTTIAEYSWEYDAYNRVTEFTFSVSADHNHS